MMKKILTWIDNSLWAWNNGFSFRFINYNDNIDRLAFFEEINNGWYHMYIYPYDDMYIPVISQERRMRLDQQPITFYVSEEDYDAMFNAIIARTTHKMAGELFLGLDGIIGLS